MNKTLILSFTLSLILFNCSEKTIVDPPGTTFTDIAGSLISDLKYSDSPFRVINSIFIDSTRTIIIDPGVKIYFSDSCNFQIKGQLIAKGQRDKQIVFTSMNEKWKGIHLVDSKHNSIFQYAIFQKIIINNKDSLDFGALYAENSSLTIRNCIFQNNGSIQGGGLSLVYSSATITNNIFRDNQAEAFGGAIISYNSKSKIVNNTFFKNYSHNHGGGLVIFESKSDSVQNNIFFQNTGSSGDPGISIIASDSSNYYLDYNFLSIDSPDPKFISETDLRLSVYSICKDSGNPLIKFNDSDGSRNDQGAYGGPLGNWYFYITQ